MATICSGFPSWGGGGGGFANCFCPGGTGIFRQQCQNNSGGGGGGFFCPPCPWPGGGGWPGWPGGGGGFCPPCPWPGGGGGWPGGPGGGWPGWGGGFCPPCPPQNNNCCCDCTSCCGTGGGACGPDNPSCNRCPWLDAASVFGGMYRSESQQRELAAGTTGDPLAMDAPLPLQNVGFNGNNTITIQCSGTYEITFFGNFRFSADTHLTFYVKANGRRLDDTAVEKDVTANTIDSFERTVIVSLCANTFLSAGVANATAANGGASGTLFIPPNGMHLEVIRIGEYRRG